mgnify:FL=1
MRAHAKQLAEQQQRSEEEVFKLQTQCKELRSLLQKREEEIETLRQLRASEQSSAQLRSEKASSDVEEKMREVGVDLKFVGAHFIHKLRSPLSEPSLAVVLFSVCSLVDRKSSPSPSKCRSSKCSSRPWKRFVCFLCVFDAHPLLIVSSSFFFVGECVPHHVIQQ